MYSQICERFLKKLVIDDVTLSVTTFKPESIRQRFGNVCLAVLVSYSYYLLSGLVHFSS